MASKSKRTYIWWKAAAAPIDSIVFYTYNWVAIHQTIAFIVSIFDPWAAFGIRQQLPSTRLPHAQYSELRSSAMSNTKLSPLPNKGHKSMRNECESSLLEIELKSNDSHLWEMKPNGQLLARLKRAGHGIMSFYTTTSTLLFQGRDYQDIMSKFCERRQKKWNCWK